MAANDGESPELVRVKLCLSKEVRTGASAGVGVTDMQRSLPAVAVFFACLLLATTQAPKQQAKIKRATKRKERN